jgi:hypothetical protein
MGDRLPPKNNPNDWDRLFRSNAPRRGGPLRALANLLFVGVVVLLLGGALFFGLRFGLDQARRSAAATAVQVETSNAMVIATRTARAITETALTAPPTTTPTAAAPQVIGSAGVLTVGNLRSQPVVAADTVLGQICPGDRLEVFEEAPGAEGATWYRARVAEVGDSCSAQRVSLGTVGWASSTLLSPLEP